MIDAAHRFSNDKRRRPEGHARQAMLTPEYVLGPIRHLFGGTIGLDPCTEPDNPCKAAQFFAPPVDGCQQAWDAQTVFCNPPYGEVRGRWVEKCIEEGKHRKVVLLIPSHTDTRIFQRAMQYCTGIVFIKGRLKFGVLRENRRQEAASHGSAIIGFGIDISTIKHLGTYMVPN